MEIIEIPRKAKKGHRNSNSRVGKEASIARSHRFLSLPLTSHYSCWTLSWLKRTFPPATLNSFNLLETGHGLQTRRGIGLVVMQMFMTKITKMVRRRKSPIPIHLPLFCCHFHIPSLPLLIPPPIPSSPNCVITLFIGLSFFPYFPLYPTPACSDEGAPRMALEDTERLKDRSSLWNVAEL